MCQCQCECFFSGNSSKLWRVFFLPTLDDSNWWMNLCSSARRAAASNLLMKGHRHINLPLHCDIWYKLLFVFLVMNEHVSRCDSVAHSYVFNSFLDKNGALWHRGRTDVKLCYIHTCQQMIQSWFWRSYGTHQQKENTKGLIIKGAAILQNTHTHTSWSSILLIILFSFFFETSWSSCLWPGAPYNTGSHIFESSRSNIMSYKHTHMYNEHCVNVHTHTHTQIFWRIRLQDICVSHRVTLSNTEAEIPATSLSGDWKHYKYEPKQSSFTTVWVHRSSGRPRNERKGHQLL